MYACNSNIRIISNLAPHLICVSNLEFLQRDWYLFWIVWLQYYTSFINSFYRSKTTPQIKYNDEKAMDRWLNHRFSFRSWMTIGQSQIHFVANKKISTFVSGNARLTWMRNPKHPERQTAKLKIYRRHFRTDSRVFRMCNVVFRRDSVSIKKNKPDVSHFS